MNSILLIVVLIAVLVFVLDFVYAVVVRQRAKKVGVSEEERNRKFYHQLWFGFFEKLKDTK